MVKIKQLVRTDLMSKSEFSRAHKISRVKLDELIADNMLNTELISGVSYISVKDKAVLDNAMSYKNERPGTYSRHYDNKMPIPKCSEQDMEFELGWRRSQGMV